MAQHQRNERWTSSWVIGGIAAVLVVLALVYAATTDENGTTSAPQTTTGPSNTGPAANKTQEAPSPPAPSK